MTLAAVIAFAAVAGPATANAGGTHGTHVDVDPQATSDGTETASATGPGPGVLGTLVAVRRRE